MALHFAGYFPKRICLRPGWVTTPVVREIWSVSQCASRGPDNWMNHWAHNDLGFYNTVAAALSVIPPTEDADDYSVLAYRVLDRLFDDGQEQPRALPELAAVAPDEPPTLLGFDAVEWWGSFIGGCSPLSCNSGADSLPANAYCLFDTLEDAIAHALIFSQGSWEPGPYTVVEVSVCIRGRVSPYKPSS